jgi:hypothetical protein
MAGGIRMTPTRPRTVPATTFDEVRVKSLRLTAKDANRPVRLDVAMTFCRTLPDGTREDDREDIRLGQRDLYAESEFDAEKITALQALFAGLTKQQAMGLGISAVQFAVETYAKEEKAI